MRERLALGQRPEKRVSPTIHEQQVGQKKAKEYIFVLLVVRQPEVSTCVFLLSAFRPDKQNKRIYDVIQVLEYKESSPNDLLSKK